jgi:nicotinamide-nucleotide amidase
VLAEIISVGTELLLGEIVDTNAAYLSQRLAVLGIDVHRRHTVGDNLDRLADQIRDSLTRADFVVLCGGLGPTEDDLTRDGVAAAVGRPLVVFPDVECWLREFFEARGRPFTQNNLRQATAPEGAALLDNEVGTAPGFVVDEDAKLIIALPGPPPELYPMWEGQVEPLLRSRVAEAEGGVGIYSRVLRCTDTGESLVAHELEDLIVGQTDPTIALYASPGEVKVRLATKAPDDAAAQARFAPLEQQIRSRLGACIYGVDDESMEVVVGNLLRARGATLAVAESCTGGLIGHRLTNIPGASDYLLADFVAYANSVKVSILGVPEEVLIREGAVSEECARAMCDGARRRAGATFALATTGIAGPSGGTPDKPVGAVFLAVGSAEGIVTLGYVWPSSRVMFKERVAQTALNMLRKALLGVT